MRSWLAVSWILIVPCLSSERGDVIFYAEGMVGVMEKGINSGPEVDRILASVGLTSGNPWCAAFNYYVFASAGLSKKVPRSGWSPDWLAGGARVLETPPASVFGIYFDSMKRIAHTGIVKSSKNGFAETIEGNTNAGGGRGAGGGDGIYRRKRSMRTLICKDWLK